MQRILHVLYKMGRGGAETFVMNVYRNINRSKFQFDFLLIKEGGDYEDEIRSLGGRIYYIQSRHDGFQKFRKNLKLFFASHAGTFSAIHCHASSLTSVEALEIAKQYKIPVRIIHSHSSFQTGWIHRILHRIHKYRIGRIATHYFACSDLALKWFYDHTSVCEKAIVVRNGIDVELFKYNVEVRTFMRKKLGLEGKSVWGHVGRFIKVKNHKMIIDVFYEYQKDHPDVHLLLVGEGELQNEIRQLVIHLGIQEKVSFLGLRSDIADLLQAMDLFLFPSFFEGLPVALVEAQAAGLPVYASDKISESVDMTGHVHFYPLKWGVNNWKRAIEEDYSVFSRKDCSRKILEAHYDIRTTVSFLEQNYINGDI